MPALEYVAGESMTSSEFFANSEQNWPWPESLDALVAAPDHHAMLLENEELRLIRTRVLPGHMVPLHTHRWPCALFILSWSHFLRRNHLCGVTLDTRLEIEVPKLNISIWQEPLPPHSLENVGGTEINTIQVEIKTTDKKTMAAFFCFA
jgi:hypothetical protein